MALKDRVIVDTYRGQVRIRSWPRKQSAETKRKNANQIRWFTAAREMAKWAIPSEINASKLVAKGKGFYPGDIQMMAAAGNLIPVIHGDPQNYEKWQPFVDPVSFQGARCALAADQTWTSGASPIAVWGVPQFQSTEFWNAGAPTLFTIPPDILKVRVTGAIHYVGAMPTFIFAELQGPGNVPIYLNLTTPGTGSRMLVDSGPFAVDQGDTFRIRCFANATGVIKADPPTWFTLEVLETSV